MNSKIVKLSGVTFDCSAVRSVFSSEGEPVLAGKVEIAFDEGPVLAANWSGEAWEAAGRLADFEGEPEANDPIYEACELYASDWSGKIAEALGRPSRWDAHQNDLRDRGIIAA